MTNEWLTTAEALALLGYKSRQALTHQCQRGVFRLGVHYTQPHGMRRRWRRSALEAHLAGSGPTPRPPSRRRSKLAPHLMPHDGAVDLALPTAPPQPRQRTKGER